MAMAHDVGVSPSRTMTILGCGVLGSAILRGLLSSSAENTPSTKAANASLKDKDLPKPTHFFACVRSPQSVGRLNQELAEFPQPVPVTIVQGENARAVQAADTVLLGCQPQDLTTCIGDTSVIKALQGKLLISILAGVTIPQINAILQPSNLTTRASTTNDFVPSSSLATTTIVRAMPNTASFVRASTTVITSTPTTSPTTLRLVDWLFTSIGSVKHVPASQFDACTALCGSTPAFFALFLESLLDSAVALGLKRSEAQTMAAETMKGAAMLVLGGETPEKVRERVATPGGSTIQGLLELERKALRGTVADALIKCMAAAASLGEKHV